MVEVDTNVAVGTYMGGCLKGIKRFWEMSIVELVYLMVKYCTVFKTIHNVSRKFNT